MKSHVLRPSKNYPKVYVFTFDSYPIRMILDEGGLIWIAIPDLLPVLDLPRTVNLQGKIGGKNLDYTYLPSGSNNYHNTCMTTVDGVKQLASKVDREYESRCHELLGWLSSNIVPVLKENVEEIRQGGSTPNVPAVKGGKADFTASFVETLRTPGNQSGMSTIKELLDVFTLKFNGHILHAIVDTDTNIWFVGAEVCKMLRFKHPANAAARYARAPKRLDTVACGHMFETPPKSQMIIDLDDLQRFCINSRYPHIKKFEDWVFDEVVPMISQKTASYGLGAKQHAQEAQEVEPEVLPETSHHTTFTGPDGERYAQLEYQGYSIRVVLKEDGSRWWVNQDVGIAVNTLSRNMARTVPADAKGTVRFETRSGLQPHSTSEESALIAAIERKIQRKHRRDIFVPFHEWLTYDVPKLFSAESPVKAEKTVEVVKQSETVSDGMMPFEYDGKPVRTIMDEDGAPWWVAKDVCDVLGTQVRDIPKILDGDEMGVDTIHTPGGAQEVRTVNEPGLYSLILRSRKAEAKRFKRWVTHEVLPQIRKTGGYISEHATSEQLQLLTEQVQELSSKFEALESYSRPRNEFADRVTGNMTRFDLLTLAKYVGESPKKIREQLADAGYLTRKYVGSTFRYLPTGDALDEGMVEYGTIPGTSYVNKTQYYFTPDGVELVRELVAA